ncbi:MAG: spore cortex biosynthesis protein YabQ [Clostridiales bacterium]|nr:spore cortex biosynthesis protein YabQ [Clostridiales bacterium]
MEICLGIRVLVFGDDFSDRGEYYMLMATSNQAYVFLATLCMGIAIGIIYDIYRVIRILAHSTKLVTAIMDILFWLTTSILVLGGFFYINDGEIRLYGLIGLALGWLLYLSIISKYVIKFFTRLFKGILWLFDKLVVLLVYPLQLLFDILNLPIKCLRRIGVFLRNRFYRKFIDKRRITKEDVE